MLLVCFLLPVVSFLSTASGSHSLPDVASNMISGHASPVAHLHLKRAKTLLLINDLLISIQIYLELLMESKCYRNQQTILPE